MKLSMTPKQTFVMNFKESTVVAGRNCQIQIPEYHSDSLASVPLFQSPFKRYSAGKGKDPSHVKVKMDTFGVF